jgi:predicted nucleic acid-binding protein
MIVADTNLVAYLILNSGKTREAEKVRECDPVWRVPPFWRDELLNVLWLFHRSGDLTHGEAIRAWQEGVGLLGESEVAVDGESVLETAIRYSITAYDAQFVTLAESLGVPLVTFDRKLVKSCPGVAVSYAGFLRDAPR